MINIKYLVNTPILIAVGIYFFLTPKSYHFIDFINLLIHEGGHGVFAIFGEFIHAAGGTIMQLLIPLLFVVVNVRTRYFILAQWSAVWFMQNMINVSVYMGDARARVLPLLGGNKVRHDWTYLFHQMGVLDKDVFISQMVYWSSLGVLLVALFLPILFQPAKNAQE